MKEYNIWQMLGVQYWSTKEVKNILINSGYGADDIVDAKYTGTNKTGIVFKVTYDERFGESGSGNLYINPNNDGFLRAEY
jgi:hypothetical protein